MIQDIAPSVFRNEYDPDGKADASSRVLFFSGSNVLMKGEGSAMELPSLEELDFAGITAPDLRFLFRVDGRGIFLLPDRETGIDPENLPPGWHFEPVMYYRNDRRSPKSQAYSVLTGYQLRNWYRDNRFWGTCGSRTELSSAERAVRCPSCGRVIYPRIVPAVIVAVVDGDRILLTKYANRPFKNYALIAGFTEIGETLEETVAREVMEEAGLRVKNIRYYKSQPWGIVDDLLAGFICEVDGSREIHMDRQELKEAEWVKREDIPGEDDDFSLTSEMMHRFKAGKL
ncbi:NAD(+) diphosphatase [Eubacterium pyruvativorans]|uniref:NAD(+) diphosphatase n=1 Tax=Eubacterium pyruvativorans TaxID=155865 RepID=UPI00156640F6|nr:NAD(+) diphosphatase [Eubacterium pyruvativorans]